LNSKCRPKGRRYEERSKQGFFSTLLLAKRRAGVGVRLPTESVFKTVEGESNGPHPGISKNKNGLMARFAYWYGKRSYGIVPEPLGLRPQTARA
jgi:hypothetical protein